MNRIIPLLVSIVIGNIISPAKAEDTTNTKKPSQSAKGSGKVFVPGLISSPMLKDITIAPKRVPVSSKDHALSPNALKSLPNKKVGDFYAGSHKGKWLNKQTNKVKEQPTETQLIR